MRENDIDVTPEMIEAGVAILYGYETETIGEEYWAEKIYKAMRMAAPVQDDAMKRIVQCLTETDWFPEEMRSLLELEIRRRFAAGA